MREIEFRGKLDGADKWVYGYYYGGYNWADFIISNEGFEHRQRVMHETIGQYTGLKDKNGTKIFENDIVGGYPHGNVVVRWNDEWACFESYSTEIHFDEDGEPFEKYITTLFSNDLKDCFNEWEVIGNIHDNPELLKGE